MKPSMLAGKMTSTNEYKTYLPKSVNVYRVRFATVALAISGILFVLYPAIRPFSDEVSLLGAAAFASTEWIIAHVMAMLGFILLTFGILGLHLFLQEATLDRLAFRGFVLSWLGTGLTLPFYGAEVFGLHAIGQVAIKQQNSDLVSLANVVRFGPGFIMILVGLLLLAIGCIMAAVAIWKSRTLPKWSGIPLALGFLLYIPQFMGTQPIRVAHGLIVAIGCLWIAVSLWRKSRVL
ncbi:hypothetical protein [Paenibacillus aceris]|uniref:Uncharacterized membrane protein YidH (DUF202 family) n=1 Tax=Paenibacillus aceris TaxID=869555 RepID=A0ABS4I3Y5_9BACL|nr:hypothetical protein [Paenibacillus aceris]MBP1965620.1 uncharacterized membrane protein YidH (DUF202 family) [Paenibacillus aceris]